MNKPTVVYKYPIPMPEEGQSSHRVVIELPKGARVLTIDHQRGTPYLWCQVDPEETEKVPRVIQAVDTGMALPPGSMQWQYLKTFIAVHTGFVTHLFVEAEEAQSSVH